MPRRNPLANGLGVCRRAATGQLFQCCLFSCLCALLFCRQIPSGLSDRIHGPERTRNACYCHGLCLYRTGTGASMSCSVQYEYGMAETGQWLESPKLDGIRRMILTARAGTTTRGMAMDHASQSFHQASRSEILLVDAKATRNQAKSTHNAKQRKAAQSPAYSYCRRTSKSKAAARTAGEGHGTKTMDGRFEHDDMPLAIGLPH
ncbi:hypothetical protein V8C42DRAFT_316555 [Trichoderma barbatum]